MPTHRVKDRQPDRQTDTQTHTHRHTDTQLDRQTGRQTHRHTQTERQTDRQAHRHTDNQTARQTDKHTDTHRHRQMKSSGQLNGRTFKHPNQRQTDGYTNRLVAVYRNKNIFCFKCNKADRGRQNIPKPQTRRKTYRTNTIYHTGFTDILTHRPYRHTDCTDIDIDYTDHTDTPTYRHTDHAYIIGYRLHRYTHTNHTDIQTTQT